MGNKWKSIFASKTVEFFRGETIKLLLQNESFLSACLIKYFTIKNQAEINSDLGKIKQRSKKP